MPALRLFARVPGYGRPAWHGPSRHPESTEHFNSVATLQHVARTLALAPFDGALVDPPSEPTEPGAIDPWLCAMVLALAAPSLRVGLRSSAARKAGTPDLGPLLGSQWMGDKPFAGPLLSVRVLVAANRWMAEDQLEYVLRHYPQTAPPRTRNRCETDTPIVVGTPQEVTDDLERLLSAQATAQNTESDNPDLPPGQPHPAPCALELVPIHIPGSYEAFVRMVAPQLRHRGLIGEHADSWRPTI